MGTYRREAIAALDRIQVDAKALQSYINLEMSDELDQRHMANYEKRARHLRHSLDHLDKQLTSLKGLVP